MNKLYIVITAFVLFIIWDKTLNNKENIIEADNSTLRESTPVNTPHSDDILCNSKIGLVYQDCDTMYSTYRDKYKTLLGLVSYVPNIARENCSVNSINELEPQDIDIIEENCDKKVLILIKEKTRGMACAHVAKKQDFIFKREYCEIYKTYNFDGI